jgi:hypothetical protein
MRDETTSMQEQHMSLSADQRNETWIPTPLGFPMIVAATQELRRADRSQTAIVCLFALIGLVAVLVAVAAAGPAFDYGGILAAAG